MRGERVVRAPDPEKVLARQPWSALRAIIPGDEAEVETRFARLRAYAMSLLEWNRGVSNLISRNDETRLVERHLWESIAPAKQLLESGSRRFVDLGSGAGLPAIPLALVGVGDHWTLVESRRNKTLFIRKIMQDLSLKNMSVVTNRLEVAIVDHPELLECDGFTSRATMTVGPTLEMASAIVKPGGRAFLWKGSSHEDERAATFSEWSPSWEFESAEIIGEGPNVLSVFKRR